MKLRTFHQFIPSLLIKLALSTLAGCLSDTFPVLLARAIKLSRMQFRPLFMGLLVLSMLAALVFGSPQIALAAGPRLVSTTGTDDNGNNCLALPCRTIQYAIGQSFPGEQIKIAAGTYTSTAAQVIYVPHSLTISGGYSDSNFTVQNGSTIIDGEQGRRTVYVPVNVVASFDHLILRNGRTTGQGAGLYASPNSPITFTNGTFEQNVADNSGGGAYGEANFTFINCRFENNRSANGVGGGVYGNANVTLQNTDFVSNTAPYGGGAYSHGAASLQGGRFVQNSADGGAGMLVSSTLQMADTLFIGNVAAGFGGGGIYIDGVATITNVQFIDNQTGAGAGGGLYARNFVTMTASQFRGNSASFGGGAYTRMSTLIVNGSFFTNTSTAGGGLFANQQAILTTVNFTNNTSTVSGGGGVYAPDDIWVVQGQFTGNRSAASGGGIYAGQMVTLSNTTFDRNIADLGGGLFANQDVLMAQVAFNDNISNGGAGVYSIGPLTATTSSFLRNISLNNGGALYAAKHVQIDKALVQNNICTDVGCAGGGFYLGSGGDLQQTRLIENVAPKGGGLFVLNGNTAITNTLFAGNFASTLSGAAIYWNSPGALRLLHNTITSPTLFGGTAIYVSNGTVNITNTIVTSHSLAIHANGGLVYEDGNLFYGVASRTAGPVVVGAQSFTGHPAFVDPNSNDYHLRATSMAINRGLVSAANNDIDDDMRPQNDGPDVGMDETTFPTADDMALSHTAAVSAVLPGQIITYTLRFTNLTQLATGVILTDLFPSTLEVLSVSPSLLITPTVGQTHIWALPDLALGESGTIVVRAKVDPSISSPTTIAQTARVGSARDNNPANNDSTANVEVWMPVSGLSTSTNSSALVGMAAPFTASISGGSNVSYTWTFGDGVSASGPTSAHTYSAMGIYTIIVTATNGLSTLTQTVQIQVNDVPITGLNITTTVSSPITVGAPVTFGGQVSAGSNVTYTWSVDGMVVGSGPTLPYSFTTPGTHTVTVTAGNGAGSQTSTTIVTVLPSGNLTRRFYMPVMKVTS